MIHGWTDEQKQEATTLVASLQERGFSLELVRDQLHIRPPGKLSEEELAEVRRLKQVILDTLPKPGTPGTPGTRHTSIDDASPVPVGSFANWRLEWCLEVGILALRLLACRDDDVKRRLHSLLSEQPATLGDWMQMGQRIRGVEAELRAEGQLPEYYWPPLGADTNEER